MALVLDRWGHAKDGEGQVVLLSGEAGIGKSRVTQVLRERIADEAFSHLRMQCSPYYTNSAFYPFIDQFERVAKFARDATPDEKLERMEELLSVGHDDLSVAAPLYAALLSIDAGDRYAPLNMSPQRQKEKTIEAIADQAAGIARHGPVLFIFEDAHWADPTTLDVLEAVIGRIQSSPVLVVITYRPEFEASWTQAHITQLALSRLAKSQCSDMVAKVTGGKALPDEVLAQIVAKTDGVPLFVEELTKTVLEAGFLKDQGDHYELDGPLPPLAIPATLQDSLIARLDRLSPVKEIAQIGAVIGREFSYELMSAVSPLRDNELTDALTELVNSELIFRRGSPPEATYTFKHALVQDAAYESLLKYKRQQLHTAIAKALEEKFPAVKATEPELLAHHYTEAGIYERAVPLWLAAGMFAQKRAAYREAEVRLGHGRDLVQSLPRSPRRNEWGIAINLGLAHALTLIKGYSFPRVGEIFGEAYRLAKEVGDVGSVFTAALGLANFCLFRGEKKKHLRLSKEMLALSEKEKDADFVVTFHSTLAFGSYVSGDALGALEHANATLGLYDPKVHQKLIHRFAVDRSAFALWIAAMAHISLGYPTKALSLSDESVEFAKVLKHTPTLAQVLFIKSGVLVFRREAHGAVRYATEALELSREHGMAYYAGAPLRIRDLTEDDWLNGLWPSAAMLAPGFPGVSRAPIGLFPLQDRAQAISYSEYCHTAAARRFSWTRRRML